MLAFTVAVLAASAAAHTIPYPHSMTKGFESPTISETKGGNGVCVSGTISIQVSANGSKLLIPDDINQFQVIDFLEQATLNIAKTVEAITDGPLVISGPFKIAATLCVPKDSSKASGLKTLQILNHGLGSDRSYWDIAPGYSYVDAMAEAGYATLNFVSTQSSYPDASKTSKADL